MPGLRESRKLAVSQAIVDATMALLRDREFRDVTVDEIATAAGIGRRTFFRYYPTKADVLLDPRRIDRVWAREALASPQPGEDDVALVMRVLAEVQRRGFAVFRPEHQVELHRLTHSEPELTARSWLLMEELRGLVATALLGPEADRARMLRVRLLASACIMVIDTGITTWIEGGMQADLDDILAEGAGHVRNGFGGLA